MVESELVFQIKVRHDTPILHEEIQRPKRPPKGPANARMTVKDETFRLRAWGLRCGCGQIVLRLGVQHDVRAPESGDTRAVAGLSRALLWGPWSAYVSITLPPEARAHLEASSAQLPTKRKAAEPSRARSPTRAARQTPPRARKRRRAAARQRCLASYGPQPTRAKAAHSIRCLHKMRCQRRGGRGGASKLRRRRAPKMLRRRALKRV